MTTNNKRISVSELDFDLIKTNLKNFLKGQSEFQDYDFEGSALSVLIDLLAYNTHYNAIYTNLAVNEMFLDSASKRSSVVSIAKMLGYVPQSAKCSRAIVDLSIMAPTSSPAVVTLPNKQPFTTTVDGTTYTFYNIGDVTTYRSPENTYTFTDLEIVEGTPLQYKYTAAEGTRYIIPNKDVDLSTLTVRIQETPSSDVSEVYNLAENLLTITESTKIYFVKEIDDGLYEVYFGNGTIGAAIPNGSVITFNYFVSTLDKPNGAFNFTYGGVSLLSSNLSPVTTQPAAGGKAAEDIDSIKFHAPRVYAAQNRAVTVEDYRVLVDNILQDLDTVTVWGGENNTPPVYGKTFICVKPQSASRLTKTQKDFLISSLQQRNVVAVTPEIVDPEYLLLNIETTVYYNPRNTTKTLSQLETAVKDAIYAYDDANLQGFDSILRFSKFTNSIDNADTSIVSNITKLTITREIQTKFNISAEYKINLINPISQIGNKSGDVISTNGFFIPTSTRVHYLDDDGEGNIRLYYRDTSFNKVIVNPTIGTVDYAAGYIVISNLNIYALQSSDFLLTVKPSSYDVVSALNQIVQVSRENLIVNIVADKTASGDLEAGYNYTFSSIT
jgi:hypothetical protein